MNSGPERRIESQLTRERSAQVELVDDARTGLDPVGALDEIEIERELPDRHFDSAAAHMSPGAYQRRQGADETNGIAASRTALEGHAFADRGRLGGCILAGKLADVVGRNARDRRHPFWRILLGAGFKLVVAQRVFVDVVVIYEVLGDDHVHHAKRQGSVRPRPDLDMPVGLLGGASADRVDDHDLGTFLPRLEDEGPGVQVGAQHVHRPDDDVFRIGEAFDVEPAGRAHGHDPGGGGARLAVAFLADGRAQTVEEGITAGEPVQRALVAQVAVIHNRLRAVLVDDLRPTVFDLGERLVIGDALKLAAAFGPDALHRVQQAVGVVVMLSVILELHAQAAPRHRVVGIAGHLDQFSVFDVIEERAGIGAVLGANPSDDTGFAGLRRHRTLPRKAG